MGFVNFLCGTEIILSEERNEEKKELKNGSKGSEGEK